jgi:hypothetical protein
VARARTVGIPGIAVLLAAGSAYLVYAGVTDTPVVEGLRELLAGRPPRPLGDAYDPGDNIVDRGDPSDAAPSPGNVTGSLGLVGSAARALPKFKMLFPTMTFYGRADRPDNPSSDPPQGKAIAAMTSAPVIAERVIALFRQQPGAQYWIWNRQIANRSTLWVRRPYTGANAGRNPHTDHVHMSFA